MSSVTISHLIGTVSLMGLFFSVGMYYSITYSSLHYGVAVVQLGKVSSYFSSNIADLVSLCYMSETDQLIIKRIEVPIDLGGNVYDVALLSVPDEDSLFVRAYLISDSTVYGETALPWSTGAEIGIYNLTDTVVKNYVQTRYPSLDPDVIVYSDSSNLVVWCLKLNNTITIGLGTMS